MCSLAPKSYWVMIHFSEVTFFFNVKKHSHLFFCLKVGSVYCTYTLLDLGSVFSQTSHVMFLHRSFETWVITWNKIICLNWQGLFVNSVSGFESGIRISLSPSQWSDAVLKSILFEILLLLFSFLSASIEAHGNCSFAFHNECPY